MTCTAQPLLRAALLLALLAGATACETSSVRSGPVAPIAGDEDALGDEERSGDELLAAAALRFGTEAEALYLKAAQAYLNERNFSGLGAALDSLEAPPTSAVAYLQFGYLSAARAQAQGQPKRAERWLKNRSPALLTYGVDPQREAVALLQARVCSALARHGCAATALMGVTNLTAFAESPWFELPPSEVVPATTLEPALLDPPESPVSESSAEFTAIAPEISERAQRRRLHGLIWSEVTQASRTEAERYGDAATGRVELGWWDLRTRLSTASGLDGSRSALDQWRRQFSRHPAANSPPPSIEALATARPPAIVAVLLPLSGPLASAGEAVRNGFVSTALARQSQLTVRFYDTASAPIGVLYEAVLNNGTEAIIGPLTKNTADALAALNPTLPVLTLNYLSPAANGVPEDALGRAPLQLGLAIEDEARSLIERLESLSFERLLVLHSEQPWSLRAAEELSAQFGETATVERFESARTITEAIGRGMLVDDSHLRSQQIFREIGTHIEFSPRARDDLDAIVALVDGTEAQVVVPALRFHFGDHLPVFATGQATRNSDADALTTINGFQVAALPWQLGRSPLAREIRNAFAIDGSTLAPLYALGSDACTLAEHLPWLNQYRQINLKGESGTLSATGAGPLRRELDWGVISRGALTALPEVSRR